MSPPCFVLLGSVHFLKISGEKAMKTMKYAVNGQSCSTCSCCGAILLSWVVGEGVCKVKWDRKPWQCGGNSMRGFAAPGTHLFLQRVPVDLVSCRHVVKLDCGKHHHAETAKKKNKRCFYFWILVTAEEEEMNVAHVAFHFILYITDILQVFVQKLHLILSLSFSCEMIS